MIGFIRVRPLGTWYGNVVWRCGDGVSINTRGDSRGQCLLRSLAGRWFMATFCWKVSTAWYILIEKSLRRGRRLALLAYAWATLLSVALYTVLLPGSNIHAFKVQS